MKKKQYILRGLNLFFITSMLIYIFTACDKDDELNTNVLGGAQISAKAYGPNPALRGQKLTFAGAHMDKITSVILPYNIEITDIEIVSDKLIKIVLPQEVEEGPVRLVGASGFDFTFENDLQISEPISIKSFSPNPIKPGQKLTIEGDYFNLIEKVILYDKVETTGDDLLVHERTKIELIVPEEAQTGAITLSNSDEIPLEYESSDILEVILPSVAEVMDLTEGKPGDVVTIAGKDLDLVKKVEMPNGNEVEFEIEDGKIIFVLPDNISDGSIVMIPASGVNVVIAQIGVALPEKLEVTPTEELRGGDLITIKGINLELVTGIRFAGVDGEMQPDEQSATELKVTFPDKAQTGAMVLKTASGKSVEVEVVTQKPHVTSFNPHPASGGKVVTLKGENLDLITVVTFVDNLDVEVTSINSNELEVLVPLNAESGVLSLTMSNEEVVETEVIEIVAPEFAYILSPPGPKAEIHAGGVLTVEVENGRNLTRVDVDGKSVNYILDAPNLYIVIPGNAKGDTELKLVSNNGEAVYTIPVIGTGIVETVIYDDGLFALSWGEPLRLNKDLFENVPAGSTLRIYMSEATSSSSIAYSDANWAKLEIDDPNFDSEWGTVSIPEGSTSYDIELTADILNTIRTVSDGWSDTGLMLTGGDVIVSRVSLVIGTEPEENIVYEGGFELDWSTPLRINKSDIRDIIRPGTIMKLYYTAAGSASFALQDANWGKIAIPDDPNFSAEWGSVSVPSDDTAYEVVLTQSMIDQMLDTDDGWSDSAILIGGSGMIISKISFIY